MAHQGIYVLHNFHGNYLLLLLLLLANKKEI